MSLTLAQLRSRLNTALRDSSNSWTATEKNQAINEGIAQLYPYNFLKKNDTSLTTDTSTPTFLYATPADCQRLCQVYISNVSTDPRLMVVGWDWKPETAQVEIPYIESYYNAKTITMVYEAAHPQLASDSESLAPVYKADQTYMAVLYWAKCACWQIKERPYIGEIELRDYAALTKQDELTFARLLRACQIPRTPIIKD